MVFELLAIVFLRMIVGMFGSVLCQEAKFSASVGFFRYSVDCSGDGLRRDCYRHLGEKILAANLRRFVRACFFGNDGVGRGVQQETDLVVYMECRGLGLLLRQFWREKNPNVVSKSFAQRVLGKQISNGLRNHGHRLGLTGAVCVLATEAIPINDWLWLMAGTRFPQLSLWFLVAVFPFFRVEAVDTGRFLLR